MHNIHTLSRLPALLSSQDAVCLQSGDLVAVWAVRSMSRTTQKKLQDQGQRCFQLVERWEEHGGQAATNKQKSPFVSYIIWQKLGHFVRGEETYPTIKTTRRKLPQNPCPKSIEILQRTRGNVLYEEGTHTNLSPQREFPWVNWVSTIGNSLLLPQRRIQPR